MNEYFIPYNCQVKDLALIYEKYFGYTDKGFFVDVGAYDGFNHSNTAGLAVAGWGGICYEPVLEYYNNCVQYHSDHPKVKVIQTCIGDKKGTVEMIISGPLSTYSKYYQNSIFWRDEYKWHPGFVSNIITLDESLKDNKVKPKFELLNLDVEGSETDVLEHFNINYWKPKMAIVEAQELHPSEELRNQAPFINKYFADAGYEKIYCDEINNIYVLL